MLSYSHRIGILPLLLMLKNTLCICGTCKVLVGCLQGCQELYKVCCSTYRVVTDTSEVSNASNLQNQKH